VGWELLHPGSDHEVRPGGVRRHGARGTGTTKTVVYNTLEEIRRFGEALMKIQAVKIN